MYDLTAIPLDLHVEVTGSVESIIQIRSVIRLRDPDRGVAWELGMDRGRGLEIRQAEYRIGFGRQLHKLMHLYRKSSPAGATAWDQMDLPDDD